MKRFYATLLAAALMLSCGAHAQAGDLGLTKEPKPATAVTARANEAVYSQLDFSDKQEAEFAQRGLMDAPEPPCPRPPG